MKWSEGKVAELKELCFQGVSNKDIAVFLRCNVTDVYGKRSQLGITIDKVRAAQPAQPAQQPVIESKQKASKLTASELKASLPAMVIWMAETAIREGVKRNRRYHELRKIEQEKESAGEPYNYSIAHECYVGVRIAAEVLWKLFYSFPVDCQKAIEEVAKTMDGCLTYPEKSYFNEFVAALEKVSGKPVQIRDEE